MKKVHNELPRDLSGEDPPGFARVQPVHAAILKVACPNLRELALHMEDMLWDHDPCDNEQKSDKERMDEVVENVFTSLESLKFLQLGGYQSFQKSEHEADKLLADVFEDEWGTPVTWVKFVKERAERQESGARIQGSTENWIRT